MNTTPNILIIMSDQHAAGFTGCYGHPVVKTPNLDRLARQGALFNHAYCPSPLCVPSRMAFMSGRRVRDIGVWDNNTRLSSEEGTWGHRLEAAGYETVLCGRMHFNGPDKLHGFGAQIAEDPDANESTPNWTESGGSLSEHALTAEKMRQRPKIGNGVALDDQATEAAKEFLFSHSKNDNPWALMVGFKHPHGPWNAEKRLWDMYDPDHIDMPTTELAAADRHPMHERNRRFRQMPAEGYPEDVIRRNRHGYYAAISRMDEKVGEVLDALDSSGQCQNTIVVYTSDHGEMLGEHGLWMKSSLFEPSIRVPLIVSHPFHQDAGEQLAHNVSLLDLTASICDWAKADTDGLAGKSVEPLLRNKNAEWDNKAMVEYYATWTDRPMAALKRDNFKLLASMHDPVQLFDLEADPHETRDLASDPDYAHIRDRLHTELNKEWDVEKLYHKVAASQKERLA